MSKNEVCPQAAALVAAVTKGQGPGRGLGMMQVRLLAGKLLDRHGLTEQGWTFQFDGARRRAGCCKYRGRTITLSRHYASLNRDNPAEIVDTLLHEIAHALCGPRTGHGAAWKAMCLIVGARPERCYDARKVVMPAGRWRAACPECAKEHHRHRRPFTPTRDRYHYCKRCGPLMGRLTYAFVG